MVLSHRYQSHPLANSQGATASCRRLSSFEITEGQGRLTRGEFCHFLGQAGGSLLELETQLASAVDLHFLAQAEFKEREEKSSEVRR